MSVSFDHKNNAFVVYGNEKILQKLGVSLQKMRVSLQMASNSGGTGYFCLQSLTILNQTIMKKTMFIILTFALSLLFTSCAQQGCTDRDADNYSPTAKKEDYSCRYSGEHIIWYGAAVADFFVNTAKIRTLHITTSSGQFDYHSARSYAYGPDKYDPGCIVLTLRWQDSKHLTDHVIITDDYGERVWTGDIVYGIKNPTSTELVLK